MSIDPIILGHNQFIGVDHFSQERARSRTDYFNDSDRILNVIRDFYDLGGTGIMLSTHPKTKYILDAIRSDSTLAKNMNIYPLIPYAQGYVRKANEVGILGMLKDTLEPASTSTKLKIMLKGGINALNQDFFSILSTFIDVEMLPFNGLNVKAIFLHNVLTDLALSMNSPEIFRYFNNYVKENYNAIPAYGTMNFVKLVESFDEWGLDKPLVMCSFNKAGFQMNPSKEECEKCLSQYDVDVLAMSTLASGYLKPKEAYEYLFSLPNIESVVVGVSTKEHANETFGLIKDYMSKV
ncbi:hypothetical protein [Methanolobus profundi]|uniref:Uncharacterized protein n=1 Tax=Methanolobus profundi TaxID=487685 RepID=A0A1I4RVV1_9EURY|nr:hypothetical protein [Methanolobus profundi]SFM56385.1 hypothetical protein SAMN04488696_1616 [Methanolobus profundi]